MTKFYKYKCGRCGTIFVADTTRHRMENCPKCGVDGPAIDLEEHYCRLILDKDGNQCEMVEKFDPPWFDDEEEYHKVFLEWLNDSEGTYDLTKIEQTLLVRKLSKRRNDEEKE